MVQESARHRTQGASGAMLGTQTHVETANQAHLGFLTAGLARLVEMVSKRSSIGMSGRRCSWSPLGSQPELEKVLNVPRILNRAPQMFLKI